MTEQKKQNKSFQPQKEGTAAAFNHVRKVIAVMSGKGGVGKSLVTGLLASGLSQAGLKTGVLDADITGPSMPMLFGLHGKVEAGEYGIMPFESRTGIKVISMNLLLENEDQPVIWRGPLVSRAIQQLWGDVMWGDLNVLLIDLPPGTSDATLTIMQSLPVDGLIMVTTPQGLASMVVRKTVHMAQIVDVKIIGIIENMAYFHCPDTGKQHFIFGKSHSDYVAETAKAPLLAHIPIDPDISDLCDAGDVEGIRFEGLGSLVESFAKAAEITLPQKVSFYGGEDKPDGSHSRMVSQQEGVGKKESEPDLTRFSPLAQEIIRTHENMGQFEHPDIRGKVWGCCGDSIQIEMVLDGDVIQDARYLTDGCYATMACGGMLTRMIKGMTLSEVHNLKAEILITALGGLPKGHIHCADLAVKTLQKVVQDRKIDEPLKLPDNPQAEE